MHDTQRSIAQANWDHDWILSVPNLHSDVRGGASGPVHRVAESLKHGTICSARSKKFPSDGVLYSRRKGASGAHPEEAGITGTAVHYLIKIKQGRLFDQPVNLVCMGF